MRMLRLFPIALLPAAGIASVSACHPSQPTPTTTCTPGDCPGDDVTSEVVTSPVPPPPLSGGTLTVTNDGKTAIVADPDRDRVLVVDLPSRSIRGTVTTSAGAEPGRSVEGEGVAYVALRRAAQVLSVDLETGKLLASTPVCEAPRGLAFDAAGASTPRRVCERRARDTRRGREGAGRAHDVAVTVRR